MFDYSTLDPNIRETVRRLHGWQFPTTDSGDGSKHGEMECAHAEPMVAISVNPRDLVQEAERLSRCLAARNIVVVAIGEEGPQIQATYDPADDSATIVLYGVHDGMWPS